MAKRRTAQGQASGKKRARWKRAEAKMSRACARLFLEVATELDQHAQRLDLIESAMLVVAAKGGVPF
jgi:hypothetical protein